MVTLSLYVINKYLLCQTRRSSEIMDELSTQPTFLTAAHEGKVQTTKSKALTFVDQRVRCVGQFSTMWLLKQSVVSKSHIFV